MNEHIYIHSLSPKGFDYDSKGSVILMDKILKSGAILSSRKRGVKGFNHFSGIDYISLSDYEKRYLVKKGNYNGYNAYAKNEAGITFPKGKFDVINPIVLDLEITKYRNYSELLDILGQSEERYTDLEDEVQVKDMINLEHMNGIVLPSSCILNYWKSIKKNIIILQDEIKKYKDLLDKHGYNVSIYDVETLRDLENQENVEELVSELKLKRGIIKR